MTKAMFLTATSTLLLAVIPAIARAHAGNDDPNVIHACIHKTTGNVRVVGADGSCLSSRSQLIEIPMHWAIAGPEGPAGPAGPMGPSGVAGLAGFTCPNGESVVGFNTASQPICAATSSGGGGTGGTNDADADGIPDALDPCPAAANLAFNGGSYCPASIYDVANGTLAAGATVWLANAMVVAVDGTSMTIAVMPGDPDYQGDAFSSLVVTLAPGAAPAIGSRVNVIGLVTPGPGFAVAEVVLLTAG